MLTIGTLSGLGLWALGIDAALALGLVGGMLTFIPYVGAVLAAVPATLMALNQGPGYAVSVVLMYVGIHFVEGNFITPLVQAGRRDLAPAGPFAPFHRRVRYPVRAGGCLPRGAAHIVSHGGSLRSYT